MPWLILITHTHTHTHTGIVKMDMNQDIKIVDMPSLAVYRPD